MSWFFVLLEFGLLSSLSSSTILRSDHWYDSCCALVALALLNVARAAKARDWLHSIFTSVRCKEEAGISRCTALRSSSYIWLRAHSRVDVSVKCLHLKTLCKLCALTKWYLVVALSYSVNLLIAMPETWQDLRRSRYLAFMHRWREAHYSLTHSWTAIGSWCAKGGRVSFLQGYGFYLLDLLPIGDLDSYMFGQHCFWTWNYLEVGIKLEGRACWGYSQRRWSKYIVYVYDILNE